MPIARGQVRKLADNFGSVASVMQAGPAEGPYEIIISPADADLRVSVSSIADRLTKKCISSANAQEGWYEIVLRFQTARRRHVLLMLLRRLF